MFSCSTFCDAAAGGDLISIQKHFDQKVDPNVREKGSGRTPLICAVRRGKDIKVIELLLANGAAANVVDFDGKSSLMYAACLGLVDVMCALSYGGACLDLQDCTGMTAMMHGCFCDKNESVEMLVHHRALVDLKDKDGRTALMIASFKGNNDIVGLLINHDADVTIKNRFGESALMIAKMNGNFACVELCDERKTSGISMEFIHEMYTKLMVECEESPGKYDLRQSYLSNFFQSLLIEFDNMKEGDFNNADERVWGEFLKKIFACLSEVMKHCCVEKATYDFHLCCLKRKLCDLYKKNQ